MAGINKSQAGNAKILNIIDNRNKEYTKKEF